jgi:hypothetical protein
VKSLPFHVTATYTVPDADTIGPAVEAKANWGTVTTGTDHLRAAT